MNRRDLLGGALATAGMTAAAGTAFAATSDDGSGNEAFWADIALEYPLDDRYTILNGGGNNPLPRSVIEALVRYQQFAASQPRPFNYQLIAYKEQHRRSLAALFGCTPDELALTRNTTEALNIVARGLPLGRGDQVLVSSYDERYALRAFQPLSERLGLEVTVVDLPVAPTAGQVVDAFADKMTSSARLLVASHIVDSWGFVLPIRELASLAHGNGAQLLVDGALGFGHIPIDVQELGCDYYATSLHKWLNAPLGTGALFVRRDRIADLWPLYGVSTDAEDIRKYESIGTRDGAAIAAIGQAIDFFELIGPERKAARLRYLLAHVIDRLTDVRNVRVITEVDRERRAGLARIVVDGWTGRGLTERLRDEFAFWIFGNFPGPDDGVYISPNVFNSVQDLDRFCDAIGRISTEGSAA